MIQLNLLPDVKLAYIKSQQTRRTVITVAIGVSILAISLLVVLLSVSGLQKKHLNDLSNDISRDSKELQDQPEINKILTVQNQLDSLTNLHAQKPAVSRLFNYLNQVTPNQVSITSFELNFVDQTATITGTAESLSSVNKYVDTLKFTSFSSDANSTKAKAFSNVVLGTFGVTSAQTNRSATYNITLNYDKNIFDIAQKAELSVPNLTTTRADLEQPADLFQAAPKKVGN